MCDKATLRTAVRHRLRALSEAERAERSLRICQRILALPEWEQARCVASFSALPDEPQLLGLLAEKGARTICLPRVTGDHLIFLKVHHANDLQPGRWSLLEPLHREEALIPPGQIDLIFVPGVVFTQKGHRMGRGRGYYDRLLAHPDFRAQTVGICFAEQIVESLPLEPHDQPVSQVISA